jgi:hypothetical protein
LRTLGSANLPRPVSIGQRPDFGATWKTSSRNLSKFLVERGGRNLADASAHEAAFGVEEQRRGIALLLKSRARLAQLIDKA